MSASVYPTQLALPALAEDFFQRSAGRWQSQRRYYTLKEDEPQEVISYLDIEFLEPGCDLLLHLQQLHQLDAPLRCGNHISWDSRFIRPATAKPVCGSTVFGILGETLYRDRGFSTPNPVTARYSFVEPQTFRLHTEYNGSVFQEEIKLINERYRTRQTIISRNGEANMAIQYLEKRLLTVGS